MRIDCLGGSTPAGGTVLHETHNWEIYPPTPMAREEPIRVNIVILLGNGRSSRMFGLP